MFDQLLTSPNQSQSTVPKWIQAHNEQISAEILRLTQVNEDLKRVGSLEDERLFANKKIYETVSKQDCDAFFLSLEKEIKQLEQAMKDNEAHYNEALIKHEKKLEDFKQRKLAVLVVLQNEAKEQLKKVQQEADQNQSTWLSLTSIAQSVLGYFWSSKQELTDDDIKQKLPVYAEFLRKFGSIAKLDVSRDGKVNGINFKSTQEIAALSSSDFSELIRINKIESVQQKARSLEDDILREECSYEYLQTGVKRKSNVDVVCDYKFQNLDKEKCTLLKLQANQWSEKIMKVVEKLRTESAEAYKKINEAEKDLKREMDAKLKLLKDAIAQFEKSIQSQDKHQAVMDYDALIIMKTAINQYLTELPDKKKAILSQYELAGARFGFPRGVEAKKTSEDLETESKKLVVQLSKSQAMLDDKAQTIDTYKKTVLPEQLLQLIKNAIENNLDFWSKQVSTTWGSRSKITDKAVPAGIAKMYQDFINNTSTTDAKKRLLKHQKVISERRSAYTFGTRNKTTTENFYRIFSDIDLETLTLQKIDRVKSKLSLIPGLKLDLATKHQNEMCIELTVKPK